MSIDEAPYNLKTVTDGDDPLAAAVKVGLVDPNPMPVGLPMPKRPAILYDPSQRVRVRTGGDRFPFPIPNGWFAIAEHGELQPGDIRPLHYFGRDLVAWCDRDGAVHLTDAYCAHQGAHLAVGGRVEDVDGRSCLRCPFHGWAYDGDGSCREIPYGESDRIPAKATMRTYPVVQQSPFVWAWYHAEDQEPFYEVPEIPEFSSDDWMDSVVREFEVATCCQEMAENNHDFAHFKFVHGTPEVPDGEEIIHGYYKSTKNPGLERETFGLGLGVVRVPGNVTFCSSVTPIDTEHVHVRWAFTSPADKGQQFLDGVALRFTEGVSQDIEIWENKAFRPRPVLVKGESGIIAHRNWAAQFYSTDHVELPDEL